MSEHLFRNDKYIRVSYKSTKMVQVELKITARNLEIARHFLEEVVKNPKGWEYYGRVKEDE